MFSMFDALFPIMFFLIFTLVIGVFIYTIATNVRTWHKNNQSPRLKVKAMIADKYEDVHHHHHDHGSSTHTNFYVTFEVESGDRLVLSVDRHEYGYLVVGDQGMLEFQGTRYLGFERM